MILYIFPSSFIKICLLIAVLLIPRFLIFRDFKVSLFPYFIKFIVFSMTLLYSIFFTDIHSYFFSFATYGCCHPCLTIDLLFLEHNCPLSKKQSAPLSFFCDTLRTNLCLAEIYYIHGPSFLNNDRCTQYTKAGRERTLDCKLHWYPCYINSCLKNF